MVSFDEQFSAFYAYSILSIDHWIHCINILFYILDLMFMREIGL